MSQNIEKYNAAFTDVFMITTNNLGSELTYQSIPAWDSVGHMALMAQLEEVFEIMLEMDDIVDFSSYLKGKVILAKYGIKI